MSRRMGRQKPRRSNEPVAWSLFGAGGMLLAFVGPALVCLTLVVLPVLSAGDTAAVYPLLLASLRHPVGALVAFTTLALMFFHTLHRACHGLHDLHVPVSARTVGWLCYGGASALSLLAGVWILAL